MMSKSKRGKDEKQRREAKEEQKKSKRGNVCWCNRKYMENVHKLSQLALPASCSCCGMVDSDVGTEKEAEEGKRIKRW